MSAAAPTDEGLMVQLREGDKEALAELVVRYQGDIFRFCLHYLKDVERSKEMAQETFVRVFTACDRFDEARRFRPWLLRIARNLCLNELKRRRIVSVESLDEFETSARGASSEALRSNTEGPDEALMAAERRELLNKALDSLDQESRELVALRFFQRMSARDIGTLVGSTEGAVRTRLHRILKTLRRKYAWQGEGL